MIELRWVLRDKVIYTDPKSGTTTTMVNGDKVLQYRKMDIYAGADGNIHIMHMQFEPVWTDWQDVPVVEDTSHD